MYHIFGYNHDIPSERWSRSVSDAEINKCLAELCDEYCEILVLSGVNTMHEKNGLRPIQRLLQKPTRSSSSSSSRNSYKTCTSTSDDDLEVATTSLI